MKINFRHIVAFVTFTMVLGTSVAEVAQDKVERKCLDIHHFWLKEAFELTKNCVGFSAPVSGRAYAYFSVGMYEGNVEMLPNLQSLSGQLNGFNRTVWSGTTEELNWQLVANTVDYAMLSYLYRNMPPSNETRLKLAYDSIQKIASGKGNPEINDRSISYGLEIAAEIIEWSKSDGADDAFNDNYPDTFVPPVCPSCWTKTTPGYLPSLLPYWGDNRQMLANSHLVAEDCEVFAYSTDSNSVMYQEAMLVLENARMNDAKYECIAEYWDDSPGYSGTPSGHFYTVASQLAVQQKLDLAEALEFYVKLGVAINDAFIMSFRLKYKYNFIRPITYIQRYIDPQFNSRIASPPFPEFPSGHSFQSGAATEVMKSMVPDSVGVVDSTNFYRTDIDGTPRSYETLTEMSEEISISRLYGGIHFRKTLDMSLDYGRRIGNYVASELKCQK